MNLKSDKLTTYTKSQVDNALVAKQNTITDGSWPIARTANLQNVLDSKPNTSDVNTAFDSKANTSEVETALALKSDKLTTYTKTQIDSKITGLTSDVNTALDTKANTSEVNTALA